jgi:hypothetical protein
MEKIKYLPLGSIVIVRGGVKKTMVVARGLAAEINAETKVFDYGGCLYPEGLLGDQIMYFNHVDIAKVVFEGFTDDDDILMVENINNWLNETPYERGNPLEINKKAHAASAGKDV